MSEVKLSNREINLRLLSNFNSTKRINIKRNEGEREKPYRAVCKHWAVRPCCSKWVSSEVFFGTNLPAGFGPKPSSGSRGLCPRQVRSTRSQRRESGMQRCIRPGRGSFGFFKTMLGFCLKQTDAKS